MTVLNMKKEKLITEKINPSLVIENVKHHNEAEKRERERSSLHCPLSDFPLGTLGSLDSTMSSSTYGLHDMPTSMPVT
jgi:hypothetical protein